MHDELSVFSLYKRKCTRERSSFVPPNSMFIYYVLYERRFKLANFAGDELADIYWMLSCQPAADHCIDTYRSHSRERITVAERAFHNRNPLFGSPCRRCPCDEKSWGEYHGRR